MNDRIKPCCRFSPVEKIVRNASEQFKRGKSIRSIFNNNDYKALREKMLHGDLIEGCYKCYLEENSGGSSIRQGSYNDFSYLLSPKYKAVLKFLEIGFSNICNLKCRTCSSTLSTAWFEDEVLIKNRFDDRVVKKKQKEKVNIFFKDEDLINLRHVKFVGGEPMLNEEFLYFLEKLIQLKVNNNCILELFTNASYFPNKKIVDNLTLFKGVRIHLSVDGYGSKNDYIRHPSKWSNVDDVVGRWLKIRDNNCNISIQLEITVSIYNVIYLEELLDWWIGKNDAIKNGEYRIHIIFVFYPEYLSIRNIPEHLKLKIEEILKNLVLKYQDYEHIIFWLNNINLTMSGAGKNRIDDFLRFTRDLDEIRGEDFLEDFSELNKIIKNK